MIFKNAQQETVGFVLIVVIVLIMGVIFLAFSIGKGKITNQNSVEISNFLDASMIYTTNCSINEYYTDIGDLIKYCYNSQNCDDGKNSCSFSREELERIVNESFQIGLNSPNRAYKLDVFYTVQNSTSNQDIFNDTIGIFNNCTSIPGAESSLVESSLNSGYISVDLEICRSS